MPSVDSGVETENDSNDSSTHENNNINANLNIDNDVIVNGNAYASANNNVSVTEEEVASFSSALSVIPVGQRENETSVSFEFGGNRNIGTYLPMSILCPLMEDYKNRDESKGTGKVWEFKFPNTFQLYGRAAAIESLKTSSTYHSKMKFLHGTRKIHPYVTWIGAKGRITEQKMRFAAATNNTIMMRKLLRHGAALNKQDDQRISPFHLAVGGRAAICRKRFVRGLLLKHGTDPAQNEDAPSTPLHVEIMPRGTSTPNNQVDMGVLLLAQARLRILQNYSGGDTLAVRAAERNVAMLLAYLDRQKNGGDTVESLSSFYSRLTLSNTPDQLRDDVKDLLGKLDGLTITT